MPTRWTVLALHDVCVEFGTRVVLSDLTLGAEPGQIVALLGPNGAGKTTTVRCCTGLLQPTSGTIKVAGRDVPEAVAGGLIGLMPQATGAWSGIRTGELLTYLATLYAHPHEPLALQELFALEPIWNTPYRRLSGGQQQAVNFAGAMIGRPEVLFLDEPTAGMDPHARRRIWQVMADLRSAGTTIVLTTHAMDEAGELADHVWIIDAGQIAVSGTVPELTSDASLEEVYLAHTDGGQQ